MTKICVCCKVEKDASAFKPSKQNSDGLYSYCRVCAAEKERARRAPIRDQINSQGRAYYESHKEQIKQSVRRYLSDPAKAARKIETQKEWLERNPNKTAEYSRRHYEKNGSKKRASARERYAENKEKERSRMLRYQADNLHIYAANAAARRAAKQQATPPWLTEDHLTMMKIAYQMAELMSERMGIKFHVDHIHPLRGENLCGLHVPWNLQVITEAENIAKGNRLLDKV